MLLEFFEFPGSTARGPWAFGEKDAKHTSQSSGLAGYLSEHILPVWRPAAKKLPDTGSAGGIQGQSPTPPATGGSENSLGLSCPARTPSGWWPFRMQLRQVVGWNLRFPRRSKPSGALA